MIDLFRFISLRPPALADPSKVVALNPSPSLQKLLDAAIGASAKDVMVAARKFLMTSHDIARTPVELTDGSKYEALMAALGDSDAPATRQVISNIFGATAQAIVTAKPYLSDFADASDALILAKLASQSAGIDIPGLTLALRAMSVIAAVANGQTDPPTDPVFEIESLPLPPESVDTIAPPLPSKEVLQHQQQMTDMVRAVQALRSVPASLLQPMIVPDSGSESSKSSAAKTAVPTAKNKGKETSVVTKPPSKTVLTMPAGVVSSLDPAVARVVQLLKIDTSKTPVDQVLAVIKTALTAATAVQTYGEVKSLPLNKVSNETVTTDGGDPGTGPLDPLPSGPASVITPVGIGDLLVVRQRLKRYEAADVAYIENVLRTESFKRDTHRLDRTQTSITTETDLTDEEERDTQATDRFSLQRESADTIKQDSSLKAGVTVSASYGPAVSVKASLDSASSTSQEDSTKTATSYSKDVTSRAASKITQTTKQIQTTLTTDEYTENVHHGFDNTKGETNISGVYQWVDKVYEAQVYNYGMRLMFDAMVPEPAAFLISQMTTQAGAALPAAPPPITISPYQISDTPGPGFYQTIAKPYGTTNLDPPPDELTTVTAEFVKDSLDPTKSYTDKGELAVPAGYAAQTVNICSNSHNDSEQDVCRVSVVVGANAAQFANGLVTESDNHTYPMNSEVGNVPITILVFTVNSYAIGVELTCRRTDRAYQTWQEKVFASIQSDYQRLQDDYQKAVADAANGQNGVVIPGSNPASNAELIQNELKKACITLLTGQQFTAFGAVEISVEGYPQVLLANAEVQGKYIRFLEEAIEWEQLMYFLYPYYWGRKGRWTKHVLASDPDPLFSDFLNSGAARVVFPVRLGFEQAVLHLLETGQVWDGGDLPPLGSPLYINIVAEIQASQSSPDNELAQGDPWEVTLPTTLVKLRADDQLPAWGWDTSNPPQWVPTV